MSNKSYYRRKMKEYQKAKSKLSKDEGEVIKLLDDIIDSFSGFDIVYDMQANLLYGEVIENFNNKSEEVSERIKQIICESEDKYYIILRNFQKACELYEHYRDRYEAACRHDDD